ncbi:MAG: SIR2 family protein [Proteobacteria bacterium]|uniref:SIR2 family protein n=1 Tax=Candidatus Avisuccinivibrio stercorigallinarum TaxID=2840704 RepID=A0A9D9GTI9_9GAMM|nr:SIR2 family protein [Candidatus Avisuccinivibrio stercorigallinarum]
MSESNSQQQDEAFAKFLDALRSSEELEALSRAVQICCQFRTTIVLGSGASCGFGLPSMGTLAREVAAMPELMQDERLQALAYKLSCPGANLEEELNRAQLSKELMEKIRRVVWECVSDGQKDFLTKNYFSRPDCFALARLFKPFLQNSIPNLNVVTTNYDQLAELAADGCGADCITGFKGEFVSTTFRRDAFASVKQTRRKTVSVFKVHGSLNWFENVKEHSIFAVKSMGLPPAEMLSELNRTAKTAQSRAEETGGQPAVSSGTISSAEEQDLVRPLIIPPSFRKYEEAFSEPYRSLIGFADDAFRSSDTVLCLGYGFNDNHIQEDLRASILDGKTLLIAASMELTPNCLNLIYNPYKRPERYLLLERLPLHVIFNYYRDGSNGGVFRGRHLPSKGFWSLDEEFKTKLNGFIMQKGSTFMHGSIGQKIQVTKEILSEFLTSNSPSHCPDDWKDVLRQSLVSSEEELLKRILRNASVSEQDTADFNQQIKDGFEVLFNDFFADLAFESRAAANKYSRGVAALDSLRSQDSDRAEKNAGACGNDNYSLRRDQFTFIHSSDPSLDGRIVYGRFWGIEALSKFFG